MPFRSKGAAHRLSRAGFGLYLWLVVAFGAFAAGFAGSAPGPAEPWFVLESLRTGRHYGPFRFQDGTTFWLDHVEYRLQRQGAERFFIWNPVLQRHYGPYGFSHGRIVDIAGEAFALYRATAPETVPPIRRDADLVLRPPRVVADPWRDVVGDVGPLRPEGAFIGLWIEPLRLTPMDWRLGGLTGRREVDLESRSLGLVTHYRGFEARVGLLMDASLDGSPVASGLMLTRIAIDGGTGWNAAVKYGLDLYRESLWRLGSALHLEYADQRFDLAATALRPSSGDNGNGNGTNTVETVRFQYETEYSDATVRTLGCWGSLYVALEGERWGGMAEIRWLAFSDTQVDASVNVGDESYSLEAERSHPLALELTVWRRWNPWVLEICGTVGAETRLRVQTGVAW